MIGMFLKWPFEKFVLVDRKSKMVSSIEEVTKSHLRWWSEVVELPEVPLIGSDRMRMTDTATGSHDVT